MALYLAEVPRVWQKVADIPTKRSTCETLRGQLLAFGGYDDDYIVSDAVYMYDSIENNWTVSSSMPSAAIEPLVEPVSEDKLVLCHDDCSYVCTASVGQH